MNSAPIQEYTCDNCPVGAGGISEYTNEEIFILSGYLNEEKVNQILHIAGKVKRLFLVLNSRDGCCLETMRLLDAFPSQCELAVYVLNADFPTFWILPKAARRYIHPHGKCVYSEGTLDICITQMRDGYPPADLWGRFRKYSKTSLEFIAKHTSNRSVYWDASTGKNVEASAQEWTDWGLFDACI